ncbi:hypothetical protein WV31_20590 [Magnetospirillum sp. ME-1]|uniref:hypothetical protein n=1 Tax=Magnetospirillum sp. ME-1 TaxID=1639348 RepID=UPI000A17E231|nr:hypothetical protein [Magnetospirillum sp. ME-1]ARJ67873.1 hypothetical protein WV31_20590 [Magnetospirillum sp. ME-1]
MSDENKVKAVTPAKPKAAPRTKKAAPAAKAEIPAEVPAAAMPEVPAPKADKKDAKSKKGKKDKKDKKGGKKEKRKKEAVIIRFEDAQLPQIDARADALGLSRAAWVRMVVAQALAKG